MFGTVSLDPQSGAFTYQPSETFAGRDSFEVSATSPALAGLPERTVVQRIAVVGDAGRASHTLANRADGSHLLLNDPAVVYAAVTSNGSPDLIEARTPLSLSPDSSGRPSSQRLLQIDTIRMGSGGGTSIVDLTSPDDAGTAMTVLGAGRGTSVFWGTAADDSFRSGGGDTLIFGGASANGYELGAGIDTLQYRAGSGARDRLSGFDPSRDRLDLWVGAGDTNPEPSLSAGDGSTVIEWGGNRLEFLGLPGLTRSLLQISTALASA